MLGVRCVAGNKVTSFTLVWIKMEAMYGEHRAILVTSFTLVWIKIARRCARRGEILRHELHARVD